MRAYRAILADRRNNGKRQKSIATAAMAWQCSISLSFHSNIVSPNKKFYHLNIVYLFLFGEPSIAKLMLLSPAIHKLFYAIHPIRWSLNLPSPLRIYLPYSVICGIWA